MWPFGIVDYMPIYNDPYNKGTIEEQNAFVILFNEGTDHYTIVEQFVRQLVKHKYATRKECIEALREYLLV